MRETRRVRRRLIQLVGAACCQNTPQIVARPGKRSSIPFIFQLQLVSAFLLQSTASNVSVFARSTALFERSQGCSRRNEIWKKRKRGLRKDWKVSKTLRRVDARSISTRFRDNSRLEDGGIDRGSKRRRGLSKASRSTITLIYIWRGGERISMPGRKSIGFPFVRSPVRRINPGVVCCFTQVGRNLQ